MEFHCEDLPEHGVVLIPPSSPEYDPLLADIQRRLDRRVEGSPPPLPWTEGARISSEDRDCSAILLNRRPHAIAAIHQFWSLRDESGRDYRRSVGYGGNPSVLLPFGLRKELLKLYGYWHVILPGSKRYLTAHGEQLGDNTDVRLPDLDERWSGGIIGASGGRNRSTGPLKTVTLTLDGVFFADGGFAGPNRQGLWEEVVSSAEAHLEVAGIARQGHADDATPRQVFACITELTGPMSDHPPHSRPDPRNPETHRDRALRMIGWQIGSMRRHQGDERTLQMLMTWGEAPVPRFRKL